MEMHMLFIVYSRGVCVQFCLVNHTIHFSFSVYLQTSLVHSKLFVARFWNSEIKCDCINS